MTAAIVSAQMNGGGFDGVSDVNNPGFGSVIGDGSSGLPSRFRGNNKGMGNIFNTGNPFGDGGGGNLLGSIGNAIGNLGSFGDGGEGSFGYFTAVIGNMMSAVNFIRSTLNTFAPGGR